MVTMSDPILFFLGIIITFIFGILFFYVDYFQEKHLKLNVSFIAGISIAYFFILLLPEIQENTPEFPLGLELFEFLFVLIGFVFIHSTEKFILQKVEAGSQKRMRKLLNKEKTLYAVEKNVENLLSKQINAESFDKEAIKEINRTMCELNEQTKEMEEEIQQYKVKIQNHINRDLEELHFFTDFSYHFIIGIILFNLLIIDLVSGILFGFFAWFRGIISNRLEAHQLFTDLDIKIEFHENKPRKILLSSAALIGILIAIILQISAPINLEIIFLMYSFISGVILYSIVREVIPEKEKGNPLYFLMGVIFFTILILIIRFIEHSLAWAQFIP